MKHWFVVLSAKFTDQTEYLTRLHSETEYGDAGRDVARKF